MEKSENPNKLRSLVRRLSVIAAMFSAHSNHAAGGLNATFLRSYTDSGRQRFGFTIKPWMKKVHK